MSATDTKQDAYQEFYDLVNMTPKQLEEWLATAESKAVGAKPEDGGESIGHLSGRRIIDIKQTNKAELSDADYDHMNKVIAYIRRHTAQRPDGDVSSTDWRYSLMSWGHDPLND